MHRRVHANNYKLLLTLYYSTVGTIFFSLYIQAKEKEKTISYTKIRIFEKKNMIMRWRY